MLFQRDHLLTLEKAALLGEDLVFDVDAGNAGGLVLADGTLNVEGVAVAGIGVANDGNVHGVGDILGVGNHFGHGKEADIGETALGGGARAGHIDGVEPDGFGDAGVKAIPQRKGPR